MHSIQHSVARPPHLSLLFFNNTFLGLSTWKEEVLTRVLSSPQVPRVAHPPSSLTGAPLGPPARFHNSGRLVQALGCLSHQPPREEPAPPREPLPSFLEKVPSHFFSAEMFNEHFQYSTWWATCSVCFLATRVSWQEPLLCKTSGSQTL